MQFAGPLIEGHLIRRYQRFLADIQLPGGSVVTAHSSNTGSMKGCCEPGSRVWIQESSNPKRKYRHTWEIVEAEPMVYVGINTLLANRLVEEAIEAGRVRELSGYTGIRREVRYGKENSRIDLLLECPDHLAYVEIKSVTLVASGIAYFPDSVSVRGARHLRELAAMKRLGHRAVIFYCVQRCDALEVWPADTIDQAYGQTLREALQQGVEAMAFAADVSPRGIHIVQALPVNCP